MNVDSKYAISFHKLTIYLLIFGAQYFISSLIKILLNLDCCVSVCLSRLYKIIGDRKSIDKKCCISLYLWSFK